MKKIILLAFIIFICYVILHSKIFKKFINDISVTIDEANSDISKIQSDRDNSFDVYYKKYYGDEKDK